MIQSVPSVHEKAEFATVCQIVKNDLILSMTLKTGAKHFITGQTLIVELNTLSLAQTIESKWRIQTKTKLIN